MTKGQRIKNRREELGMGQTELAQKVGISKQSLYKYEKDIVTNIPSDIIEALARALDISPASLMGWKENNTDIKLEFEKYYQNLHSQESRLVTYLDAFAKLSSKSQDKVIDYMNYQIEKENSNAQS